MSLIRDRLIDAWRICGKRQRARDGGGAFNWTGSPNWTLDYTEERLGHHLFKYMHIYMVFGVKTVQSRRFEREESDNDV